MAMARRASRGFLPRQSRSSGTCAKAISRPRSRRMSRTCAAPLSTPRSSSVDSRLRSHVEAARICTACGIQFPLSAQPPRECPICADYRQFVPRAGQRWTTLEELRRDHRNAFQQLEPGLIAIATTPEFAIGERALLLRTPAGNVLWDCISLIDDATIEIIRGLGGLQALALSHPHYYTTIVEWSRAFGVPVLVHEGDREWVVRQDAGVTFWTGETHD